MQNIIESKENIQTLEPIWKDNYTAIAMSSSDEYLPYLAVCIQSIVDHTSSNHNYDIIIFSSGKNEYFKQLIIDTYSSNNISIRFFNPKEFLSGIKLSITHNYFHESCYYRIVAPTIMPNYKKLIFTDIDLIFTSDIQELYKVELNNHPIAACLEPIWKDYIEKNSTIKDINIIEYSKNILKLKDITKYYNTGVMLINIKVFNENNYFEQLKQLIKENVFLYQEQDALNCLLNDDILPLNNCWNYEVSFRNTIVCNETNAKIVHYLGGTKPWHAPSKWLSHLWWQYARRTPYYEIILQQMMNASSRGFINSQIRKLIGQIQASFGFRRNILKYWRYKILSKIMFGKNKEHYSNKKQVWKEKIKAGKLLRGEK